MFLFIKIIFSSRKNKWSSWAEVWAITDWFLFHPHENQINAVAYSELNMYEWEKISNPAKDKHHSYVYCITWLKSYFPRNYLITWSAKLASLWATFNSTFLNWSSKLRLFFFWVDNFSSKPTVFSRSWSFCRLSEATWCNDSSRSLAAWLILPTRSRMSP